jgi:hypothetical protein
LRVEAIEALAKRAAEHRGSEGVSSDRALKRARTAALIGCGQSPSGGRRCELGRGCGLSARAANALR